MNIRITNTTALFPSGYFVQWTVDGLTASDVGNFSFTLSRSGGPNGPWELLFTGQDQYSYKDDFRIRQSTLDNLEPNSLRMFQSVFYKVDVVTPQKAKASTIQETGVKTLDRATMQIRRKALLDFRTTLKFNGTPGILLKKRRWGLRCKKCYDPVSKEVVRPNCAACWGTGMDKGYWTPFVTYFRSTPTSNTSAITPAQKSDANGLVFTFPDYPNIERDDILIRLRDNKRFRLDAQTATELLLSDVHQDVTGQEISHSDVIYQYAVNPNAINPLY